MQDVWEKYWSAIATLSVENVVMRDPYYDLLRRLIDLSKVEKWNVLEVGCGSGIRTLALATECHRSSLAATLIDCCPAALAFARKNASETRVACNYVLADGFNLPFPDGAFDVVWNEGVNEHFYGFKRQQIFKEMSRVCKVGGQVIVMVPNALNLPYRIWKQLLMWRGRWEYGYEKPFSIFELRTRVKTARLSPDIEGGVMVLRSFHKLIPRKKSQGASNLEPTIQDKLFKWFLHKIENRLERSLGSVIAENIGIRATKGFRDE